MATIKYTITPVDPAAHLFEIECEMPNPDPNGQCLSMPAWIPGSYMIRDFAKHVLWIEAQSQQAAVKIDKVDKDSWQCEAVNGSLQIRYQVYAWDLSVRAAHLDTTHGFYNGTSVFLRVIGQEMLVCEVEIRRPEGQAFRDWRLATTLAGKTADQYEFGLYQADSYDELIDHPVEMGTFLQAGFKACGAQHDIAVTGLAPTDIDIARICRDLQQVCEYHLQFFGGTAPFKRYLFQIMLLPEGFGGLEHSASCSLICPRSALPRKHEVEMSEEYRDFLSLCSHEYFHVWNVKRIRPEVFSPYDLQRENHTRLLWAFEGITSYYEDLALLRCGVITVADFLELFAQKVTQVLRSNGRKVQTLAQSSFDAWTKFYKQDENVLNAVVSYYSKGALAAFCFDQKIRALSNEQKSLDDVMHILWQRYGCRDIGVPEQGVEAVINEVAGQDLSEFSRSLLDSTDELPLLALFERIGIVLQTRAAENQQDRGGKPGALLQRQHPSLALRFRENGDCLVVTHVINQGAAHKAGIAAGDCLIAINRVKLTVENFEQQIKRFQVGDRVQIHLFRRDELMVLEAELQAAAQDTAYLQCIENVEAEILRAREAWIKG